ncbi:hypothetical protein ANN_24074 [Periplaneta americana]|uniref:Ionotropic glutamate receptor C-terminal domain-containing protein n=1 Tax=Periplaneta americana TaxID=6978 RepID=A0ABQ8S2I8_PERAM|nr:hypothetical protein ANN_24074 [Periplaneta americana]
MAGLCEGSNEPTILSINKATLLSHRDMLVRLLFLAITSRLLYCHVISEDDHWVRCITNISIRYFNPGQTLVMLTMSPSVAHRNTDVQAKLTAKIHELNVWPVISYPCEPNISKTITEKFKQYIILLTAMARFSGNKSERLAYQTFDSSFTNVWAVIVGVSVSFIPRTSYLRIFFFIWVSFSLVVNTVLQCFLTTYLVEPGYEPPVKTIDEMKARNIKICVEPLLKKWLTSADTELSSKLEGYFLEMDSDVDCINMVLLILRKFL